jgi:phosphatidylserine/phosphatidylglycerophosphate/cardiolipin synthase-like enzyme
LFFLVFVACTQKTAVLPLQTTDFCSDIHRNDSISLSKELEEFKDLMIDKTGVYVLEDGAGSMVTRAWLTEYAEKSIDIQYFIFSTDNIGLIACDYLIRAADRGVKVRIIVDDIMVDASLEDILTVDAHENISIKIYNPGVNLGKNLFSKVRKFTTDFRSANQRMHNKTFIVDHKVVITGGRNIADEYFDYDHEYNFRDRDVLLLGKVTQDVNTSFNEFWGSPLSVPVTSLTDDIPLQITDENRYERLHQYACNPENFWPQIRSRIENLPAAFSELKNSGGLEWTDQVTFVSDVPGKNDGTSGLGGGGVSTSALIELVKKAKYSVDIQTPYLITSELSRNLFAEAIQRGVKIRILTNSLASTDNVEAFSSYQSDRKKLLGTGVSIFEFRPDAAERSRIMTGELQMTLDHKPIFGLHAKSMVIDGETTVIGTFNLDPRSANLNTECVTIIHSEKVALGVLQGMELEFRPENSWRTTLEFNPDSEVDHYKRLKTWTRKILPKSIL